MTAKKPAAKPLDVDKAAAFLGIEPDELRRSWARGLEPGILATRNKGGELQWTNAALKRYQTAQIAASKESSSVPDASTL